MNQRQFEDFIIDHQIIGVFQNPITLKSGKKSHFYVNWRQASSDAFLLDQISDHIALSLESSDLHPESIFGVPEGASILAITTAMKWAKRSGSWEKGQHTISMGRGRAKSHGQAIDRLSIGIPKGRVIVLEDTMTTGQSAFDTVDQLLSNQINVIGICCLCDRMERDDNGKDIASKIKDRYGSQFHYLALSRANALLQRMLQRQILSKELVGLLETEIT